ncbi:hypothetical protein ACIPYU_05600 [Paenarthrobacter nicotinovorans]|uniref:hypothetical protein n=1 Tax=Paenarthrobacter nicotinovorans TaxID=29320 RepID=UPI0037FA88D9
MDSSTTPEDDDLLARMRTSSGMTLARMREIEEAIELGEPLALSVTEEAQYQESKSEMKKMSDRLKTTLNATLEPINKRLKSIIADAVEAPRLIPSPQPMDQQSASTIESLTADIASGARQRQQQEDKNSKNLAETAMAMQDLLKTIQDENKSANTKWWWSTVIFALTLVAAAIAAWPVIVSFFPK